MMRRARLTRKTLFVELLRIVVWSVMSTLILLRARFILLSIVSVLMIRRVIRRLCAHIR